LLTFCFIGARDEAKQYYLQQNISNKIEKVKKIEKVEKVEIDVVRVKGESRILRALHQKAKRKGNHQLVIN
jgi:hypothetical protein